MLYHASILPHFQYCSETWYHCGQRNTEKLEKVNGRALRLIYKDKTSSYTDLQSRAKQPTLTHRRIHDMMLVINKYFNKTVPAPISKLIEKRSTSHKLRGQNILSIPKVNSTKYGLKSFEAGTLTIKTIIRDVSL